MLKPLAVLQTVLIAHALAVFAQSVFAGEFLSGSDSPVRFHEWTGWAILAICTLQVVIAAILLRSGKTSLWLVLGSTLLLLAEGLQTGTGYGRFLNVHIPLGVIIFGAVTGQAIAVWRRLPSGGMAK